jgi:RNA polymerase sigma factor (sigma-70 family)
VTTSAGFDEFFERTFPGVLATATLLSTSRHDAEDAVQEAYSEALARWDTVGGYEAPEAWVRKVMKQRLWKAARRRDRQIPTGLSMEMAVAPQAGPEQTAEARAVIAALAALPGIMRFVLVMHCLNGVGQKEIAQELGLARSTVAVYVHNARRALERSLGMTPSQRGDELLVPVPGMPITLPPQLTDPLALRLRASERWLCTGLAADPRTARRIRTSLAAAPPVPERRRLLPRLRRAADGR